MTTADLLADLSVAGVRVELRAGVLHAGPKDALTAEHRELIRAHKPALVALLAGARRLWTIVEHDGNRLSVSFAPPATLAEVRASHPTAKVIEPDFRHREPLIREPTPEQETAVRGWLNQIGERDAAIVTETLDRIRSDSNAFDFFMALALEPDR